MGAGGWLWRANGGRPVVGPVLANGPAVLVGFDPGGTSPRGDLPEQRRLEAGYADAWYESITQDMFG